MADFLVSYEAMILAEGGYKLTDNAGDSGGQTYAGISRVMNPQWSGWAHVDRGDIPPTQMVRDFYRAGWWAPLQGDDIVSQAVATNVFSFAVNTSGFGRPLLAIKLLQAVVGVTPDGSLGPKTLAALNAMPPEVFIPNYALAKLARYRDICMADKSRAQAKTNLLGWINRILAEAAL